MRNMSRSVQDTAKSGKSVPAVVSDIAGSKVSVRLSNNGAIYTNLNLVGGPVSVGSAVHVDFTTPEPTVVAPGHSYDAEIEALPEAIEPPITETGAITVTESGMIEVYLPGEWSASGSAGDWWKDPNSGSFFDANSEGLDVARTYAVTGSAIFLPRGEIGGNHDFWYGITIVGYGQGESFLTGVITLREGYDVRELSFVSSIDSSSAHAGVIIFGDGYFYSCDFTATNYGSGISIGLCNTQTSVSAVCDSCHFEADYGIYGNVNGSTGGLQLPFRYHLSQGTITGWHVDYAGDGLTLRFTGEDGFGADEWMVDGFGLYFRADVYDKDDVTIHLVWNALSGTGHGESNPYSSASEDGHRFEDVSFWHYLGYSGSINPLWNPEIPVEDESAFVNKNGTAGFTSYGPGDQLSFIWTHQDHGLGSDTSTGSAGNQSERTVTNWLPYPDHQPEYCYVWLSRWMGATTGSNPRLNQNGYDLDLRLAQVYMVDTAGWKKWIYPLVFTGRLRLCSFDCATYDVDVEDSGHIIADTASYNEIEKKLGPVTLESDLGVADFSSTAPSDPFPGQLWYPIPV